MRVLRTRVLAMCLAAFLCMEGVVLAQGNTEEVKQLLGDAYAEKKEYGLAEKEYREILAVSPDNNKVRMRLAEVLTWSGKYSEAEEHYKKVLSKEDSPEVKVMLAKCVLYSKDYKRAQKMLTEIVKNDARNEEANILLARAYAYNKEYDEAIVHYKKVLLSSPRDEGVMEEFADVLSWNGEYPEAISEYEDLLRITPGKTEVKKKLANVYSWNKEYEKAALILRELVEKTPDDADSSAALGEILTWAKKYGEAEIYFKKALAKRDDPKLWAMYARCVLYSGDIGRAKGMFDEILKKDPKNIDAEIYLADAYAYGGDYKKAIQLYRKVLENTGSIEVKNKLADVLSWSQKYSEAIKMYEEVLKEKGSPEVRKQLARVMGWAHDYDGSIKMYQKAYEMDKNELTRKEMEAKEAYWNSRVKKAISGYNAILKEDPENAEALFDLGQIYSYQSMWGGARKCYNGILKMYPNHSRAKEGLAKEELISRHVRYKAFYEFYESDSSGRDSDIRRHSFTNFAQIPCGESLSYSLSNSVGGRSFTDFNDIFESKTEISAAYNKNPDWWVDAFYSLYAYSRDIRAMHNFGGSLNSRVMDIGVSAFSYRRERLENTSSVIRKGYYSDDISERLIFDVNRRVKIGGDYLLSFYSDDNVRNRIGTDILYYFSFDPLRLTAKYRYTFDEYRKKTNEYFAPKGFSTNSVLFNWRHYLNRDGIFFGADDIFYDVQYDVSVDSQYIVGHKFGWELGWDINKNLNVSIKASIADSSVNVYKEKRIMAAVQYYF